MFDIDYLIDNRREIIIKSDNEKENKNEEEECLICPVKTIYRLI